MSDSIASELIKKWAETIKQGDPNEVTLLYDKRALLLGTFSAKERVCLLYTSPSPRDRG